MTVTAASHGYRWKTPEHGQCATHRPYRLDCDEFDRLYADSEGRCRICRVTAQEQDYDGPLHIDHDPWIGKWAVRGLLCQRCNTGLAHGRRIEYSDDIQRYLDDPWWKRDCISRGLPTEEPSEPPHDAWVLANGYSYRWKADENGGSWQGRPMNRDAFRSWHALWRDYGPRRIRVELPKKNAVAPTVPELQKRIDRALAIARGAAWCLADQEVLNRIISELTSAAESEAKA